MLIAQNLASALKEFIDNANKKPVSDQDKAITDFCQKQEDLIYDAIKNVQITIPPGVITVEGPTGILTNISPIVINSELCKFQ